MTRFANNKNKDEILKLVKQRSLEERIKNVVLNN